MSLSKILNFLQCKARNELVGVKQLVIFPEQLLLVLFKHAADRIINDTEWDTPEQELKKGVQATAWLRIGQVPKCGAKTSKPPRARVWSLGKA